MDNKTKFCMETERSQVQLGNEVNQSWNGCKYKSSLPTLIKKTILLGENIPD